MLQLNANDYVELFVEAGDGVNSGNITLSAVVLSISRVSA